MKPMKPTFFFELFILICVTCISCNQHKINNVNNITIENEQFKLIIGTDGFSKSLLFKPTNEECLITNVNTALFSVTQERPYHNEIKLSHPRYTRGIDKTTVLGSCGLGPVQSL